MAVPVARSSVVVHFYSNQRLVIWLKAYLLYFYFLQQEWQVGKFADLISTHPRFSGSRAASLCVQCRRAATRIQLGVPALLDHQLPMRLALAHLSAVSLQRLVIRPVRISSTFRQHRQKIPLLTAWISTIPRRQTRTTPAAAATAKRKPSAHSATAAARRIIRITRSPCRVLRTVYIAKHIIRRHTPRMFQHRTLATELVIIQVLLAIGTLARLPGQDQKADPVQVSKRPLFYFSNV